MQNTSVVARIVEVLGPHNAIVELLNEPGVKWTAAKRNHLVLLRRLESDNCGDTPIRGSEMYPEVWRNGPDNWANNER